MTDKQIEVNVVVDGQQHVLMATADMVRESQTCSGCSGVFLKSEDVQHDLDCPLAKAIRRKVTR